MLTLILLIVALVHVTLGSNSTSAQSSGNLGVDVSATISTTVASCLLSSENIAFVVPRGYQSLGKVDSQVCPSLINAYNAGVKVRDVYMFPCPTCSKSASTQVSELLSHLSSNCKQYWSGRVWLDVEGPSNIWKGSSSANQAFYKELVDACKESGVNCGIYTSASQWQLLFGSDSFAYGSYLPLWYAHYDGKPSFSDFSPFAGWSTPFAKQYVGDTTLCGMSVDLDYSPNWAASSSSEFLQKNSKNDTPVISKQSVFSGDYSDPNHPGCQRNVKVNGNDVTINGSDNVDGSGTWTVFGKIDSEDPNKIIVDFSPKGGPSNLHGTYDFEKNGIRWEDNNLWSKL